MFWFFLLESAPYIHFSTVLLKGFYSMSILFESFVNRVHIEVQNFSSCLYLEKDNDIFPLLPKMIFKYAQS